MKKILHTLIFIFTLFIVDVRCQNIIDSDKTNNKFLEWHRKNGPELLKDAITGINNNTRISRKNNTASTVNHHLRTLYFGASKNSPSTAMKANAFCSNIIGFNAGIFIPGPTYGAPANFSYGFCLGFELFHSNKYELDALPAPYNISGQKAPPTIASNIPKLKGTKYEFGLQFNIVAAKNFVISPIFGFGTMYIYQRKYSVTQTTRMNSGLKSYELSYTNLPTVFPHLHVFSSNTSNDYKSAFLIPKLRLQYYLGSTIGLWTEVNYFFGPQLNFTTMEFYPNGNPDKNGEYTISQIDAGYSILHTNSVKFNSLGLNFGLSIALDTEDEIGVVRE